MRIKSSWTVNLLTVDVHFNIEKKWVQIVLYVCNDMNSSLFVLFPCRFLIRFCLFFALFFHLFVNVSFVSTTLDKFQRHCRIRLSQINVVTTIRLKFKLYAFFIEWDGRINFLFVRGQDIINSWDFPYVISRNCLEKLVPKLYLKSSMRNVCKNVSSRPTGLFGRFFWDESASTPFPAVTTQLFP